MIFTSGVARRGARWGMGLSLVVGLGFMVVDEAAAATYWPQPRAAAYRFANDTFAHQESALAAVRRTRDGGDYAYYGNRLKQFQFIGPEGQGGIYDAMKNFKDRRPLQVKNYQYRW